MRSEVPRGLVENKARQRLARALMHSGPLTARGLMQDTRVSIAGSRYHLRALASAGAVRPFLKGAAKDDEVAWVLTPEKLPEQAREVLLGEVSLQICFRLAHALFFEGRADVAELAAWLDLSEREINRHIKAIRMEEWAEGTSRYHAGNRADWLSDYDSSWVDRWIERLEGKDDEPAPREDGAE